MHKIHPPPPDMDSPRTRSLEFTLGQTKWQLGTLAITWSECWDYVSCLMCDHVNDIGQGKELYGTLFHWIVQHCVSAWSPAPCIKTPPSELSKVESTASSLAAKSVQKTHKWMSTIEYWTKRRTSECRIFLTQFLCQAICTQRTQKGPK